MINNLTGLGSLNGSMSVQASSKQHSSFDNNAEEQAFMGFVMPDIANNVPLLNQNTVTTHQQGPNHQGAHIQSDHHSAVANSILVSQLPANLQTELKQLPQLSTQLTHDTQGQLHFQLPADVMAKSLSTEAASLIQQQAGQVDKPAALPVMPTAPVYQQALMPATSPQQTAAIQPQTYNPSLKHFSENQPQNANFTPNQFNSQFTTSALGNTEVANSELDSINQVIQQLTTAANKSPSSVSQWGPVSVTQSAPLLHQAHEMMSPLREQLRFQIDQQIKQAELRLDPPELGKVELNIRLDGDRLHVQMHAANPAVRDALLMGLDRLRMELEMDHGGQVDVDVDVDVDISQQQPGQDAQKQQHNIQPELHIAPQANEQVHTAAKNQQDQVDLLA
ncbi:flagellar hook-length control protein FliK [Shewanella donghaensis]|uniref:flagellar hook-length control protein FliK n=1 Tax=Shewanella donghaensis TaxID=238836 RepID=UPI0011837DCD|nr:flagellar hook-length control protein FliK [Shewanella donghaensis]